jgi:hypothetical protein
MISMPIHIIIKLLKNKEKNLESKQRGTNALFVEKYLLK